jgi:hypothetical protein
MDELQEKDILRNKIKELETELQKYKDEEERKRSDKRVKELAESYGYTGANW